MRSSLAPELGGGRISNTPNPSEKTLLFCCPAAPQSAGNALPPAPGARWPRPQPQPPADPRGGLLTLSPAHCVVGGSQRWGLMPADTDTMAARTGHEGTVDVSAAQLPAALAPESRGGARAGTVTVPVTSGLRH